MTGRRQFIKTGLCSGCAILGGAHPQVNSYTITSHSSSDELWQWSREAIYWEETPRGVKCLVCPNECTLKPGETSQCHNRISYKGKLYSIAYGNPCAVHVDPMEKKPLFHFLPGSTVFSIATAGCNFACLNCQNWTISQVGPKETKNYDLPPAKLVTSCQSNNCKSVAFTYSEPATFFEYMIDSVKLLKKAGIHTTVHSNGFINEKPLLDLCNYLDAANIDLKSFSEQTYLKLSGGKLDPVLRSLKVLHNKGVWLEITSLLIPGWTDDMQLISTQCKWLVDNGFSDVPLHFSRFMPQYKLTQISPTPLNTLVRARETAMSHGLKYVYIGNVAGTNAENTYCPKCKTVVVERKGYKVLNLRLTNGNCSSCSTPIAGIWE
jgi:pyruvate formate lyase activating enzyme